MEYTLKDYQADAVANVLGNLTQARSLYRQFSSTSRFALSAVTGAGKTVMAAAVIEALFFGSDEFDFTADPGAVVLWFSDDPSLNEQSRRRIQAAGGEQLDSRLRIIEATFSEPKLQPGNVYFLNAQKLSKGSRLVRGDRTADTDELALVARPDEVQSNIYDVIAETIADDRLTLYFVQDEAHRGWNTSAARERTTIVQRLVNGHGMTPAMPIVWGISATTKNFEDAFKNGAQGRVALPPVEVDAALVQDSGLLKDNIVLSIPAESGVFDTVLLKRGVRSIIASTKAWADYAKEQGETSPVVPLLVVQVPDGDVTPVLTRAVDAIFEEWPDLPTESFANVFGEHADLSVSQVPIPYVAPETVQDQTWIQVLFAKTAISTGWDCPRAEVLVSFRVAENPTHITQLLGRMVRTPLARRIPGNEVLNSVECLLPFFDRKTATEVAQELMRGTTGSGDGDGDSGGGPGRRVLFDPVTLLPNPDVPEDVWERFEATPSQTIPKRAAKPVKRLTAIAHALSEDGLIADAGKQAHALLHAVLDGRRVQYKAKVDAAVQDVLTMEGEELHGKLHSNTAISRKTFTDTADHRAIQDSYRAAGRVFSADLARTYVGHLAGDDADDDQLRDAAVVLASLALVPEVAEDIDDEANKLAADWLVQTRVQRKGLTDERQAVYDELESMTTAPQPVLLTRPRTGQADTKARDAAGNESELETKKHHLLCDENGDVPIDLNEWEKQVLAQEMGSTGFVAWWRNPSRTAKDSLAIAYRDLAGGTFKALRPDFLFFSRRADGSIAADIVDPHGHHMSDAIPKLRGMADFAETFGSEYGRIEAVAKVGETLRVLDLTKPAVRQAVRDGADAKALYESAVAVDY